jgi:hypothetical protein
VPLDAVLREQMQRAPAARRRHLGRDHLLLREQRHRGAELGEPLRDLHADESAADHRDARTVGERGLDPAAQLPGIEHVRGVRARHVGPRAARADRDHDRIGIELGDERGRHGAGESHLDLGGGDRAQELGE